MTRLYFEILNLFEMSKYDLGVSIALRKYPVTSRTWKSSLVAATVVPGELGVRIARCTLLIFKPSKEGFFICLLA